jgi:anti-anti-sigma factor
MTALTLRPDRARSPPGVVRHTCHVVVAATPGRPDRHAGSVVGPMDLSATNDVIDGTPVLSLFGEADLATLPSLLERVNRFVAEHPGQRVLLDLDGLGSMAPIAVGVLVGARLTLRGSGGDLDLVCAQPGVMALFTRSGLDTTFPLYPSVRAALDRTG